ncbi:Plasmodium exported protein (Pm-fam-a like), unknown function [Plasmodium malariae]|uniref:Fam-l protein n=1 Tax=Plasmodium malariae TaxID=5858 RepID=A0A1A8WXJ1_PLAMA|nr:Plasmodium exported protein (Pm-fam-a like), unknown function [Plasmodium malariae]
MCSTTIYLKEENPINVIHKKNNIYNNEKDASGKKKPSNENSSENSGGHKPAVKNKTCTFETKKYSPIEKKIFKELDYTDFLKNNRTINNRVYKKIIRKKYGLRIVLPIIIVLFLLIIYIIDISLGYAQKGSLLYHLGLTKEYIKSLSSNTTWNYILEGLKKLEGFLEHATSSTSSAICSFCDIGKKVSEYCKLGQLFRIAIYCLPFLILSITIISGIIYYHKKVKKYDKIKLRKK